MGLMISHKAWHAPYSIFMEWRKAIAQAIGIPDLERMDGYKRGCIAWSSVEPNPLHMLLNHSDYDGEMRWQDADAVTKELERIMPMLADEWQECTQQFIKGYRTAAQKKENLEFR